MDVTVDEVFKWRDLTGFMGREVFGRRGAHANAKTYEELKRRCDMVVPATDMLLPAGINSFSVHVAEDVPDGFLRPCDCGVPVI